MRCTPSNGSTLSCYRPTPQPIHADSGNRHIPAITKHSQHSHLHRCHLGLQAAKSRGIPVIYDEVFTGCWRLGPPTAGRILGETPDIACYAKLLTGGVAPLAVTLSSEAVFDSFKGESKVCIVLWMAPWFLRQLPLHAVLTG